MTVQVGDRIEGVNNQYGQDFSFISGVVIKVFESGDIDVLPDSYENPYSWPEEGTWTIMSWNYRVVGPAASCRAYEELLL